MFNYYFDVERGEEHIATRKLFDRIAEGKYESYTSLYVTNELEGTKTGAINTANGYHAVQIYSPTEVLKHEKTRSD
jgi:hypothetical protein